MPNAEQSNWFAVFVSFEDSGDDSFRFAPVAVSGSEEQAREIYNSILMGQQTRARHLLSFDFEAGWQALEQSTDIEDIAEEYEPIEKVKASLLRGYASMTQHICAFILFNAKLGVNRWALEQSVLKAETIKSNGLAVVMLAPDVGNVADIVAGGARRKQS